MTYIELMQKVQTLCHNIALPMTSDPENRVCIAITFEEDQNLRFEVINLFALRATNPDELLTANDPTGPRNEIFFAAARFNSNLRNAPILCAWGANKFAKSVVAQRLALLGFENLVCLGTNADGSPKHPLYVKADTPLTPYEFKQ